MFIVANFISSLAYILSVILTIYYWLIIIRALISWVNPDPFNPLVQFLVQATEPFLKFIRKLLPFLVVGGIDLSPLVAIMIIIFLKSFLVATLSELAFRLH
ncbi:MAG: YggT family protein [Candidatus Omnitrophica bacterium]|nr:YggT family protein [Candidatus Omnitrophota bacterium]